jgi:hypothetical protein
MKTLNKEEKYYTPSIEEFHVGFEFKWFDTSNGIWLVKEYNEATIIALSLDRVRVKYLDSEDIKKLGWEQIENQIPEDVQLYMHNKKTQYKGKETSILLYYIPDTSWILISLIDTKQTVFAGKVYNKSELEWLMKRLGIWQQ